MRLLPAALLICLAAIAGSTNLAFDAASIRPDSGPTGTIQDDPGMLTMRGVSLKVCIEWAWNVQPFQISGPAWLTDSRFEIIAKAPKIDETPANIAQLRLMLQTLLSERFGLKLHHEKKDLPVYFLGLAPNGPRFHETGSKDSSKFLESTSDGPNSFGSDKTGLNATRVRMLDLAAQIAKPLERPVIDKTGLNGRYDLRIDVTPYLTDGTDGKSDELRIIFDGMQSQLGLKLEPGRDAVDFLIVDAANKAPTAN